MTHTNVQRRPSASGRDRCNIRPADVSLTRALTTHPFSQKIPGFCRDRWWTAACCKVLQLATVRAPTFRRSDSSLPPPSSLPFSWGRRRLRRRRRRRRRQGPFAFGTQDRPSAMTSSHHTRARSRPRPPVRDSGEVTPGTAASRLADADGRGTMEIHLGASRRCAQE